MYYDSDELRHSEFTSIDEMNVSFIVKSGRLKVEKLEKYLEPLVKEQNFNFEEFKKLFKEKLQDQDGHYVLDQQIYDFLRPFIPHFPLSIDIAISAFWCYNEGIDTVFYGRSFWNLAEWREDNEGEELPEDLLDLLEFDDEETANPHEWLSDCEWVLNHEEEIKKWFKKKLKEEGEEYDNDEDARYDNFKRFWEEFSVVFPEAWAEFKKYVFSI